MNMRVAVVLALVVLALVPVVVADTYTLQLRPGFNLFGAPLSNILVQGTNTAPAERIDDLLYEIDRQAEGTATAAYKYGGAGYTIHVYGSDVNDFSIDWKEGMWIFYDGDSVDTLTFQGTPFPTTNMLELTQGFNLINIPISHDTNNPPTASDVAAWVAPACTRQSILYKYGSGGYEMFITNKPPRAAEPMGLGTDFAIAPGEGYWLYCSGSGTVTLGPAN
jgi:hypothetical protein